MSLTPGPDFSSQAGVSGCPSAAHQVGLVLVVEGSKLRDGTPSASTWSASPPRLVFSRASDDSKDPGLCSYPPCFPPDAGQIRRGPWQRAGGHAGVQRTQLGVSVRRGRALHRSGGVPASWSWPCLPRGPQAWPQGPVGTHVTVDALLHAVAQHQHVEGLVQDTEHHGFRLQGATFLQGRALAKVQPQDMASPPGSSPAAEGP